MNEHSSSLPYPHRRVKG